MPLGFSDWTPSSRRVFSFPSERSRSFFHSMFLYFDFLAYLILICFSRKSLPRRKRFIDPLIWFVDLLIWTWMWIGWVHDSEGRWKLGVLRWVQSATRQCSWPHERRDQIPSWGFYSLSLPTFFSSLSIWITIDRLSSKVKDGFRHELYQQDLCCKLYLRLPKAKSQKLLI